MEQQDKAPRVKLEESQEKFNWLKAEEDISDTKKMFVMTCPGDTMSYELTELSVKCTEKKPLKSKIVSRK